MQCGYDNLPTMLNPNNIEYVGKLLIIHNKATYNLKFVYLACNIISLHPNSS